MPHRLTILLVVLLAVTACSSTGGDNGDGNDTPPPASVGDDLPVLVVDDRPFDDLPLVDVATALEADPGSRIQVRGALFVDPDGTVRLCDAIAESFPPQCGGERVGVQGLDLALVPGLQTEGEVSWAEGVTLVGSVE